ncbi:MAG: putative peptide modification system cyclase [Rudaea sp.]
MSAIPNELPVELPKAATPAPVLRTLAICDLADSTALVEKLGDQRGADIMRQHDRVARDLVEHHGGREIDKTDGFLIMFDRPVQAVAFALDYQRSLCALGVAEGQPLAARIGIHVGDVVIWDNNARDIARGAKPVEVEGLVKPTAARIMSIARPGQILASGMASTLAQRARSEIEEGLHVRWRAHGNYRFKGLPEPVQVHEVGEEGVAPFRAPAWSGKAHREIPWWRRPGMLFVEVAVVIAALGIPAYFALRSPPAIAFAERDWVVVGNLKNQTGQTVLDDSLDTAFRISLEQSRFVNLVPALQLNDALKRMGRPDGTRIDRTTGSEIAMREGARALILPSIAEIGGRVRVTAEVIDPRTQATVFAETADGTGLDSVLPSVGKVSGELRARLGEALASVEANNAPLPRVSTSNLDALRAYSLGLQSMIAGRDAEAIGLLRRAIELDANFALAYMAIARVYSENDEDALARDNALKAAAMKDRLSTRDRLYVDAWLGSFGPPGQAIEKWQLLGKLYPDSYAASNNSAYFAWQSENRFADAVEMIQPALSEHSPFRGAVFYSLASLQAAQDQFPKSLETFATAASIGYRPQGIFYADAYASQRRFADAGRLLDAVKPTGIAAADLAASQLPITLQVDQGNWIAARQSAFKNTEAAVKAGARYERTARAIQLTLDEFLSPPATQIAQIKQFISHARDALIPPAPTNHDADVMAVLYGAYLAAQVGDFGMAQSALTVATPHAHRSGYPNLEHMLAIVEAELSWREGRPDDAISRLEPTVDGSELYLTHVALAAAYAAAGRNDRALAEARWLTAHRGRAYLEWNASQMLQARNVIESNLGWLVAAEQAHALSHDDEARAALAEFDRIWPATAPREFLSARVDKLGATLHH